MNTNPDIKPTNNAPCVPVVDVKAIIPIVYSISTSSLIVGLRKAHSALVSLSIQYAPNEIEEWDDARGKQRTYSVMAFDKEGEDVSKSESIPGIN